MKRNPQAVPNLPPPAPGHAQSLPIPPRPAESESVEQIGWGDAALQSLQTRLFHGFRPDFEHDPALWAAATHAIIHAIRTFGSEEKAYGWLTSKCGALDHERPYDLLKQGRNAAVEEELDRIDYGVFV